MELKEIRKVKDGPVVEYQIELCPPEQTLWRDPSALGLLRLFGINNQQTSVDAQLEAIRRLDTAYTGDFDVSVEPVWLGCERKVWVCTESWCCGNNKQHFGELPRELEEQGVPMSVVLRFVPHKVGGDLGRWCYRHYDEPAEYGALPDLWPERVVLDSTQYTYPYEGVQLLPMCAQCHEDAERSNNQQYDIEVDELYRNAGQGFDTRTGMSVI